MIETGNLTIDRVASLRSKWLELLSANNTLELNVSSCETADLAGIQLLVSFLRSSQSGSGLVVLRGTPSPALIRASVLAGLSESDSLSAQELEEKIKAVL